MKLIFILSTLWLFSALSVCAQHADDNRYEGTGLQAYLEFCLSQREAMQKKSTDQLRECIEESTQSEFRFNDVRILMQELGDDLEEVIVPGVPKVSMEYTPDYVDQLLMHDTDYRDDELEGPALMRDAEAANCLYTHKALGPKQAGVYRIQCAGENRLICVPSPDGLVSVNVSSESGMDEPLNLDNTATDERPYTDIAWEMDDEGSVLITVRNLSDKPISFVLAME